MQTKLIIGSFENLSFNFNKYINCMLNVIPKNDLSGITTIEVINLEISNYENPKDFTAQYWPSNDGKDSRIEVNVRKISSEVIPEYIFNIYKEVAALWLSEYIFHEIGHHVHQFKRHGVKKKKYEEFASKYAKAGYLNYLISRKRKILKSFKIGTLDIISLNKKERKIMKKNFDDLCTWLKQNK